MLARYQYTVEEDAILQEFTRGYDAASQSLKLEAFVRASTQVIAPGIFNLYDLVDSLQLDDVDKDAITSIELGRERIPIRLMVVSREKGNCEHTLVLNHKVWLDFFRAASLELGIAKSELKSVSGDNGDDGGESAARSSVWEDELPLSSEDIGPLHLNIEVSLHSGTTLSIPGDLRDAFMNWEYDVEFIYKGVIFRAHRIFGASLIGHGVCSKLTLKRFETKSFGYPLTIQIEQAYLTIYVTGERTIKISGRGLCAIYRQTERLEGRQPKCYLRLQSETALFRFLAGPVNNKHIFYFSTKSGLTFYAYTSVSVMLSRDVVPKAIYKDKAYQKLLDDALKTAYKEFKKSPRSRAME